MRVDLQAPQWATHFLSDLTDWARDPLPIADLGPFDLPDDVYFEYAYQDAQGDKRPDPDNTQPRQNPWWPHACHLTGPAYQPDPLSQLSGHRTHGQLLRLDLPSKILGQSRRVLIYSPAGLARASLPLVLFNDGKAYLGWGKLPQIMDRLAAAGHMAPAHLVFVPPQDRTREYAFNTKFQSFLTEEVLPFVEQRVQCTGERIIWGASLGGLLAAEVAWARPDLFQTVVSQSGAYLFSPDMDLKNPFAGNESFCAEVLASTPRDVRWYLDCGTLEWLLPSNRNLVQALANRGHDVAFQTRPAGHNWTNWRNGLAQALKHALPVK